MQMNHRLAADKAGDRTQIIRIIRINADNGTTKNQDHQDKHKKSELSDNPDNLRSIICLHPHLPQGSICRNLQYFRILTSYLYLLLSPKTPHCNISLPLCQNSLNNHRHKKQHRGP